MADGAKQAGGEMTVATPSSEDVEGDSAGEPEVLLSALVRAGTFLLGSRDNDDGPTVVRSIVAALEDDPRVTDVEDLEPLLPKGFNNWPTFQFFGDRVFRPDIEEPSCEPFEVIKVPQISFSVEVPLKNQRNPHGGQVTTTEYEAVWDGFTLAVAWHTEPSEEMFEPAGGHVVVDVLEDAVSQAGKYLFIQPCVPGCENEFSHTTMLFQVGGEGAPFAIESLSERLVYVLSSDLDTDGESLREALRALMWRLGNVFRDFALMQDVSAHTSRLLYEAYSSADHLLAHQEQSASATIGKLRQQLVNRWRIRGWRKESRRLIAGLWLRMGRIESLRRRWLNRRDEFETEANQLGARVLFEADYLTEAQDMTRFDTSILQAEAQHAAETIDNRDVVRATVLGAFAGAVAGGLVGLLG